MLLFVDGDFTAMSGNNSDFSGILYVTGNAVIEGPFQFRGAMIVAGTLKVGQTSSGWGGAPDLVSIVNDQTTVQKLRDALARYRISKDMRPSASKGAFADPADLRDIDAVVR
jgi:formylmethanofuran dehydrogenase subunit C